MSETQSSSGTNGQETMENATSESQEFVMEEHYDPEGQKLGMWLFLYTELLVFSGMFLAYGVYLYKYHEAFLHASHAELDWRIGAFNTVVLLTSSLTMALAIGAIQRGKPVLCNRLLGLTIFLAIVFFVIKGYEWKQKFDHDLYPGTEHWINDLDYGTRTFVTMYFTMTGMHALHVLIGVAILAFAMYCVKVGKVTAERFMLVENSGLFWHLVDLVWIFLFPLFYLIA